MSTRGGPWHPPGSRLLLVTALAGLCDRLLALAGTTDVVVLDVSRLQHQDVGVVEALARATLAARRHGAELVLCGADDELVRLLDLTGLADLLPRCGPPGLEHRRQPEPLEQRCAQEVVDVDHLPR